jgi:hypothetical protein
MLLRRTAHAAASLLPIVWMLALWVAVALCVWGYARLGAETLRGASLGGQSWGSRIGEQPR